MLMALCIPARAVIGSIISFLPFSTQGKQPSYCRHHRSMTTWCIDIRQGLLVGPEHKSWPKQNDDKKRPNNGQDKQGRSNDCYGPVFHFINAKIIPPIPVSMTPLAAMMTFSSLLILAHNISYLRVQTCSWLFSLACVSSIMVTQAK